MESYIVFAIIAYFLLALHGVADKFILTNSVRHPVAYAFYAGTSSIFVFFLAPFGLQWLSPGNTFIALIAGACFLYGMFFLYSAIKKSSVSRILPVEGGLVPLFTYVFAYLFLNERLGGEESIAIFLLSFGAITLSVRKEEENWRARGLGSAVIGAVLFAISAVLIKHVFDSSNLVTGLVWSRVGLFGAAVLFLAHPEWRRIIVKTPKDNSKKNIYFFYGVRLVGAVAGLLLNYSIAAGSVVIVNALQGVQFVFVLLMTSILSLYFPKILLERINSQTLAIKVFAVILITAGLTLLSR